MNQSQVICPKCQRANRIGARFCGGCGASLPQPFQPRATPPGLTPAPVNLGTGRLPPQFVLNDRYLILEKIGQGGMGAIYKVVDTRSQQILAVKEMSDSAITSSEDRAQAVQQFEREAGLLRSLQHPNLPYVTDKFTIYDRHYLVMEFIDGQTLEQMIEVRQHPFAEEDVVNWAQQLCDVLSYLHRQMPPIIFRDLKPGNIMINREGQVKLIDFGIVRLFTPGKKQDTMLLGTPGFAAPEQYGTGQSDAQSDIYSLGVTLFTLLTSVDPASYPLLQQLPPVRQLNTAVSAHLEQVILRATQIKREQRWPSTGDLQQALAKLPTASLPVRTPPLPTPIPSPPGANAPPKSHRPTTRLIMAAARLSTQQLALAGLLTLALIVVGAWVVTPLIARTWFWYNVHTIAIIAPLAYAAVRRRGVGGLSHAVVAVLGGAMTWIRGDVAGNYANLFAAALISAAAIEGMVALLPRVMGARRREDAGAWQREAAWLGATAVVGDILLTGVTFNFLVAFKFVTMLTTFILGGLGWFLGDLIQGYLFLKQTGAKWRSR